MSAAAQEAWAGVEPRCVCPCLHGSTATALQAAQPRTGPQGAKHVVRGSGGWGREVPPG